MNVVLRIAAAAALSALAACETVQTTDAGAVGVTRQQRVSSLVTAKEVEAAADKQYDEMMAVAQQKGLLNRNQQQVQRVRSIAPHIERELAAAGISGDGLVAAGRRVVHALTSALSDPRARWLLGPHSDAGNELRFSMQTRSGIKRIVLDRTFVENGARWIIDYKTGTHQGADVEGFLDRERLRYGGQLELYARALGGGAQLGLYFPLLNGWRAWTSEKDNDDQDIAD